MSDYILAAVLLTTPPGTPAGCPPVDDFVRLRDAVHQVAIEWEILDPREARYVMTRPEEFCPDLNMLRRRRVDLADAPKLRDVRRFPERAAVNELVRFNRAFRKHVDQRCQLEPDRAAALEAVVGETERLYKVWDAVRDSRCEFYYVTVRRQALRKLRDMVGPEAYDAADLPPHVPTWRFEMLN